MQTLQALSARSNAIADAFAASSSVDNSSKLKDRCDIISEAHTYIINNVSIFKDLKWTLNAAPSFSISAELPKDMVDVLNSFGSMESRKNGVSISLSMGQMQIFIVNNVKGVSYVSISANTSDHLYNVTSLLNFIKTNNFKLSNTADAVKWYNNQIQIISKMSDIIVYNGII